MMMSLDPELKPLTGVKMQIHLDDNNKTCYNMIKIF